MVATRRLAAVVVPVLALFSEPVRSEEAKDPPRSGEEIVVTARKREEDVQKVPIAVTVVTGERLEEEATADLSELQTEVPNLAINQGRNQSTTLTVFLRGVGQVDPLWGVDPGIGVYLDDVYVARAQGALLDVFDVERLEVLRGPQGTLYGRNTIGGAIKYVSRPVTEKPSGFVSVTAGTQSTLDVRASASGALIPQKLRGRIAVASLQHDGFGVNRYTGRTLSNRDTLAGRGTLEWLATKGTAVKLSADFVNDEAEPKGYQRLAANPFCPQVLGSPCAPLDSRFDTEAGIDPRNGMRSGGGSLLVTSRIHPSWSFKSITAYRQSESENNIDFDTTPARIADIIGTLEDDQFSQEFQFTYDGAGRVRGIAGAYYFDGEAGGVVKNIFTDNLFTGSSGQTETRSIALFGDATYRLGAAFNVNAGLRATTDRRRGIAFNAAYTDDTFRGVRTVTASYDQTKTFDSVAPRFGVDYHAGENVMTYLSWSRGFKSGGFNIRAQSNVFPESALPFEDEVLDVTELGVKAAMGGGGIVLNTALFHGKYRDIQVSTFTAFDSNGDGTDDAFFGNFLNAGNATIRGAELEFDLSSRALRWLSVRGHAGWLDAEPDEVLDRNEDGFVDTQVITNAPDFTGSLNLNFHMPLRRGVLTASAGASHRGDAILTNEGGTYPGRPGTPLLPISQEAYTLYEAWVSWLSPDARWRFGINGKNLSDTAYLYNGYNVPTVGVLTGSYGTPRTVIATLEYRFF